MRSRRSLKWRLEERVRSAWRNTPAAPLRLLSAAYAATAGTRNLLYDAGVLAARRAPLTVVSVGGLTVGGASKTPIAADIAARLEDAGVRTAVLTHGYADELEVHRRLSPRSVVYGGRDRMALARRAHSDGAEVAILDSGFQHRRLHRDLDIVALDTGSLGATVRHLPAGPYREGIASLARADLIVLVHRTEEVAHAGDPGAEPWPVGSGDLVRLLESESPPPMTHAWVLSGPLFPVNELAARIHEPAPTVAVAGIMWPEVFFRQVQSRLPSVTQTLRLPDHAAVDSRVRSEVEAFARGEGVVCTLKDAGKLALALGEAVPIWYVSERVLWAGADDPPTPVRMALGLADRRQRGGGSGGPDMNEENGVDTEGRIETGRSSR